PMSALDPVVSEAALPLWLAGKYRQAVNDAATSLNVYAQGRIGRHDISDQNLMAQAFSEKDPEAGKPRLRCPGNPETETVKSQMDGARVFAIGTFQAIRNPAHHLTGGLDPDPGFPPPRGTQPGGLLVQELGYRPVHAADPGLQHDLRSYH